MAIVDTPREGTLELIISKKNEPGSADSEKSLYVDGGNPLSTNNFLFKYLCICYILLSGSLAISVLYSSLSRALKSLYNLLEFFTAHDIIDKFIGSPASVFY